MSGKMIETYKLRVYTVEAVQLVDVYGETSRELLRRAVNIALWCDGSVEEDDGKVTVTVPTPSGSITAEIGDFIVYDGADFSVMNANAFNRRYSKIINRTEGIKIPLIGRS